MSTRNWKNYWLRFGSLSVSPDLECEGVTKGTKNGPSNVLAEKEPKQKPLVGPTCWQPLPSVPTLAASARMLGRKFFWQNSRNVHLFTKWMQHVLFIKHPLEWSNTCLVLMSKCQTRGTRKNEDSHRCRCVSLCFTFWIAKSTNPETDQSGSKIRKDSSFFCKRANCSAMVLLVWDVGTSMLAHLMETVLSPRQCRHFPWFAVSARYTSNIPARKYMYIYIWNPRVQIRIWCGRYQVLCIDLLHSAPRSVRVTMPNMETRTFLRLRISHG